MSLFPLDPRGAVELLREQRTTEPLTVVETLLLAGGLYELGDFEAAWDVLETGPRPPEGDPLEPMYDSFRERVEVKYRAMERLQGNGIYDDPTQVALLQEEILEALKRLEFGLRRQVEGASEGPASLAGSGDVPDEYRQLVEEYYRKLAASGRGGGARR